MRPVGRTVVAWCGIAVSVVAAVALALLVPLSTAQRMIALGVVGVGVIWLTVLLWALHRTSDGLDRLGGLLPLALDLLPALAMVTVAVVIDGAGPRRSTASWLAGLAAGAVLLFPFSFTLRWLWTERQRRRNSGARAAATPGDQSSAGGGSGRSGGSS